ncbi:hypothetical protein OSG_eHP10_00155 [environmental Halophage eHP-10]|nr:hypothetical protein OSG_eHP10_00155 [environmental Halophage eHP-10]
MSDLRDDLEAIDGVGPATADKILDVLDAHDTGATDPLLERAKDAAARGDDRDAAVYLRRAGGD